MTDAAPDSRRSARPRIFDRRLAAAGLIGLLVFAAWFFWPRRTPRLRHRGGIRSNVVDRSAVSECEILWNGEPVLDSTKAVASGATVTISGRVAPVPEVIPFGLCSFDLEMSWHPAGTPESVWVHRDFKHHFRLVIAGPLKWEDFRQGDIRPKEWHIDPVRMPPGDYELRFYFRLDDSEGEMDRIDYLGSARLKVLPAADRP